MKPLFITGIGTGIGKTLIAAILTEKLRADYWKPIQSGDLEQTDTMAVRKLVTNTTSKFHPEAYRLTQPYSPHKSAALDGITIEPGSIELPATVNQLIIEGAGGILVPLNAGFLMINLVQQLGAEVIVVAMNYLGSINHTLMTIAVLKEKNIPVRGIIFNGPTDRSSEDYILNYTGIRLLGKVPFVEQPDISALAAIIHL